MSIPKAAQLWPKLLKRFTQLGYRTSGTSWYDLTLGSRDSDTGWRAKTYTGTSLDYIFVLKEATRLAIEAGVFVTKDAVMLTDSAVEEGDMFFYLFAGGIYSYYDISVVKRRSIASGYILYECDLTELSMYEDVPGAITWSKTRPRDPRYRTKYFIDQKARATQITKDNDSTQATWACIFNDPPYPVVKEFRAASSPVQGLYVVDQPNSTALINCDQTAYNYLEHVPVHVCTVDSTDCSGWALMWKMIAELRYICETYPTGSLRLMEGERKEDRNLGGMWLYDRVFTLEYRRDATT